METQIEMKMEIGEMENKRKQKGQGQLTFTPQPNGPSQTTDLAPTTSNPRCHADEEAMSVQPFWLWLYSEQPRAFPKSQKHI